METILSKVKIAFEKYRMAKPKERLLVACSGGPDSVALFHLLKELAPSLDLRLALIHFDHALRPGSAKDLEFVRKLAREHQIPFYGQRARRRSSRREAGLSPEEAARKLRYEFFERVARKTRIRKIALGHHRDDQAETVLMRMVQGTGLRGLQGIRPVMRFGKMVLIRPLIGLTREEIRRFLKQHGFAYREDRTNRSPRFLRNRIRSRLLPFLEKEFNPEIREALCRLAETAAAEAASLDEWVSEHKKDFFRSRKNGTIWLERDHFLSLPGALQFRLLDQFLRTLHPKSGLDYESWQRIRSGLAKGRYRATLPRKMDLRLTAKKFLLQRLP